MLNNSLRFAFLLVLAASITACGFHLRGSIPLSDGIKNMYVDAPEGPFKEQLEDVLTSGGAEFSATKVGADAVLVVTRAETVRTVGTLSERGKVDSYKLKFTVEYVLQDVTGELIRPPKTLFDTRQYNFDPETVIETEAEEAELQESMEQDIALRIVRQLSVITDFDPLAVDRTKKAQPKASN